MLCFDTEKWTNSHALIYCVFCESIFYKTPTFSITFSIILRLLELLRFPNSWRSKCNSWRNNCVGAKSLGRATERSPWDGCRDEILGGYRYTPRILNELIPTKMAMFFLPEPTLLQTIMLDIQPLAFGEGNGYYYTSKSWMLKKKHCLWGFWPGFSNFLEVEQRKKTKKHSSDDEVHDTKQMHMFFSTSLQVVQRCSLWQFKMQGHRTYRRSLLQGKMVHSLENLGKPWSVVGIGWYESFLLTYEVSYHILNHIA